MNWFPGQFTSDVEVRENSSNPSTFLIYYSDLHPLNVLIGKDLGTVGIID